MFRLRPRQRHHMWLLGHQAAVLSSQASLQAARICALLLWQRPFWEPLRGLGAVMRQQLVPPDARQAKPDQST